jgi:hypothetical protein
MLHQLSKKKAKFFSKPTNLEAVTDAFLKKRMGDYSLICVFSIIKREFYKHGSIEGSYNCVTKAHAFMDRSILILSTRNPRHILQNNQWVLQNMLLPYR